MSNSDQGAATRERFTNRRVVATLIAIVMTTVAGVAFGYVGEWGRDEEPTTRNVIVLGTWIFLLMALTLSQLLTWSKKAQVALAAVLLLFVFSLFATYRHQQMGNLGDSTLYFQIATYQTSHGAPRQLSLSSLLAGPLNQALFDIRFKNLWIVPLVLGFVLFAFVILSPKLLGLPISMKRWFPTAVLLFISGSFILYFFRTYMEFYTFPALVLGLGIFLSLSILPKGSNSLFRAFIAGLLVGIAPALHTLFVPFSGVIALWVLSALLFQYKSLRRSFVYLIGLLTPGALVLLIVGSTGIAFSLGNFGSATGQGLNIVNPHLFELENLQERTLIAGLSFPLIFLALFLITLHNQNSSTNASFQNNSTTLAVALLFALLWIFLLLIYNPAGGIRRERDFMLAPTIPLLALVIALKIKTKKLDSPLLTYGLLFSCVVTATVVSSFIEPTFDTGALLESFIPG